MNETSINSTSWFDKPELAKQAKEFFDNVPTESVGVAKIKDGELVTEILPGPAEVPQVAIEVAQPTLPKKRGRPEKVSKDIFQEVWNKCETLDEVAETLGLPRTSVSVKASNMRKLGCVMKRMKKARKPSC